MGGDRAKNSRYFFTTKAESKNDRQPPVGAESGGPILTERSYTPGQNPSLRGAEKTFPKYRADRKLREQSYLWPKWFGISSISRGLLAAAAVAAAMLPFHWTVRAETKSQYLIISPPPKKKPTEEDWKRAIRKEYPNISRKELKQLASQLQRDPTPIPPRLGSVFVPNIVKGRDVAPTKYSVLDRWNRPVAIAKTGFQSFVLPGQYTVKIGTHATDILPSYRIKVRPGKITVIRIRWAALIVRVVDTHLIQFRGTYDLIHLETRKGIGTGIGADDTLGEKVKPWLLPPGLYMIVRVGDSYLARTNFFTVRLRQGEVTYFRLVMDRESGQFLGGGELPPEQIVKKQGGWEWNLQLSGNFLWNQLENVSGSPSGHSFNMTTFLFARLSYNRLPHFFLLTFNTELGFTIPSLGDFRKSTDLLDLQAIYIYRIPKLFFGPYVRFGVETVIFPDTFKFNEDDPRLKQPIGLYYCKNISCELKETYRPGKLQPITLSDYFDPLLFKQGIGLDLQAVQTNWFDLRILFGLGFRQEIARNVFQFDPRTDIATERCKDPKLRNPFNPLDISSCPKPEDRENFTSIRVFPKETNHREGLELALVSTGRITRFVSFTFELDILSQFSNFTDLDINGRATVTFRLSHFASLNYRIRVRRDPALPPDPNNIFSKWSLDQSLILSLSILL